MKIVQILKTNHARCERKLVLIIFIYFCSFLFFAKKFKVIFTAKKSISIALMRENPVRRPIVPPIAENMSNGFAALSLVILSKVGVSKKILCEGFIQI